MQPRVQPWPGRHIQQRPPTQRRLRLITHHLIRFIFNCQISKSLNFQDQIRLAFCNWELLQTPRLYKNVASVTALWSSLALRYGDIGFATTARFEVSMRTKVYEVLHFDQTVPLDGNVSLSLLIQFHWMVMFLDHSYHPFSLMPRENGNQQAPSALNESILGVEVKKLRSVKCVCRGIGLVFYLF